MYVPVVSNDKTPLMPCHPARARELVRKGKAVRRFNRGLFYIQLVERRSGSTQPVAVGIDPGSKKEGFTVKSRSHTYLNIQSDAVTWVKDSLEVRSNMRRSRRQRNTPCRKNRMNRKKGGLPPSTKARWQWKLRLCKWLTRLYPVSKFVVEDIKAVTKGKRRWDVSFSPLEVGKTWFYSELENLASVSLKQGWDTKELRDELGLKKTGNKKAEVFSSHCVDSWVLANWFVGGHIKPDYERLMCVTPLRFHRRQLHRFQPKKNGKRTLYGGTMSLGLKRGSLVKHPKYGTVYVGGTSKNRISLHSIETGKRIVQNVKVSDCQFLTYNTWRSRFFPALKDGVSTRKNG